MYFVFAVKTKHKSISYDNGKITGKEMSKLFSCDCLTIHYSSTVRWNVAEMSILKRSILSLQQKKMMDFDYFGEYVRSISNKILLRQC